MKKPKIKFEFTPEFQLEILRYIIRDPEGPIALTRVKPSYLTLIEHGIIAEAVSKYFKKRKKIPSENVLKQVISEMLESKDYIDLVTKDDIPIIKSIIKDLYSKPIQDSEYIQEKIWQFSTYVEMKNLNDSLDLNNFDQYGEYSRKVDKILQNAKPAKKDEPLFFIQGLSERQFRRQAETDILPSPYWQLNELTNAGGYPAASILVLLDKPKAKKTFFLINLAKGYLRMKKSVLYVDLENGKAQIMDRLAQTSIGKTKKELYSGVFDKLESKHIRKLSRLGVEFVVQRMPAMVTDANAIRELILELRSRGINIQVLMIDYLAKMASINRDRDDFERISNAYVDIQNLAEELHLDCVWTANHITREGSKHRTTRYQENDIAKCVDIVRHAQVILGLNATAQEEKDGIQRLEVVVQRDGKPTGRALFKVDVDQQKAVEFTRDERKSYDQVYAEQLDDSINKSSREPSPKKPGVKPVNTGDI